jgi:hypothetical protein
MRFKTSPKAPRDQPSRRRLVLIGGGLLGSAGLLGLSVVAAAATPAATGTATAADADKPPARALEGLGIEFVDLQLAADSYLIGLRYRVTDVVKSKALIARNVRPVLVNETTGDRYYVPNAPAKPGGQQRHTAMNRPVSAGKIYSMMFANPDRKLRTGEKVTLYAGDSILKGLEVH